MILRTAHCRVVSLLFLSLVGFACRRDRGVPDREATAGGTASPASAPARSDLVTRGLYCLHAGRLRRWDGAFADVTGPTPNAVWQAPPARVDGLARAADGGVYVVGAIANGETAFFRLEGLRLVRLAGPLRASLGAIATGQIAVISAQRAVIGDPHEGKLYEIVGGAVKTIELPGVEHVQGVAVDANGVLWVQGYAKGTARLLVREGEAMRPAPPSAVYPAAAPARDGAEPRLLGSTKDAAGRTWGHADRDWVVETREGTRTVYPLGSGVPEERCEAFGEALEPLPAPGPVRRAKAYRGKLSFGGKPYANAEVQLCAMPTPFLAAGASPCGRGKYDRRTQTDENGSFVFEDLPVGRYEFAARGKPRGWFLPPVGASPKPLAEGEDRDRGTIDLVR